MPVKRKATTSADAKEITVVATAADTSAANNSDANKKSKSSTPAAAASSSSAAVAGTENFSKTSPTDLKIDLDPRNKLLNATDGTIQIKIAKQYLFGQNYSQNFDLAMVWLEKAVEQNNSDAMYYLAWLKLRNPMTEAAAVKLWEECILINPNHHSCLFFLGFCHERGLGNAERSLAIALEYYKKSADNNNPYALCYLQIANLGKYIDGAANYEIAKNEILHRSSIEHYLKGLDLQFRLVTLNKDQHKHDAIKEYRQAVAETNNVDAAAYLAALTNNVQNNSFSSFGPDYACAEFDLDLDEHLKASLIASLTDQKDHKNPTVAASTSSSAAASAATADRKDHKTVIGAAALINSIRGRNPINSSAAQQPQYEDDDPELAAALAASLQNPTPIPRKN